MGAQLVRRAKRKRPGMSFMRIVEFVVSATKEETFCVRLGGWGLVGAEGREQAVASVTPAGVREGCDFTPLVCTSGYALSPLPGFGELLGANHGFAPVARIFHPCRGWGETGYCS